MSNNIRYTYFKSRNSNHRVACAVIELPGKGSPEPVKVAFAFVDPNDVFTKKMGREVATGRLEKGNYVAVPNTNIGLRNLVLEAAKLTDVPGWFRRGAKSGSLIHGLRDPQKA
jgi:hypothetical protein